VAKKPARPHENAKAARRVLSPDELWAGEINRRLRDDCHPDQRDAVDDPARRYTLLIGRGGTKTTTFRGRGILKITTRRRAEVLYLATTREHARELNWDKLKDANEHYGLELDFNESRLVASCRRTGGRYLMSGMEDDRDIERYRGKPYDEVQIDEAASHDPDRLARVVYRVIGPRLGERGGCLGMAGTPGHYPRGLFYDATRPGSPLHTPFADRDKVAKPGVWSSHAWSLADIVALPGAATKYPALVALWAEALLEKAENGWSDDNPIWRREYLGQWASDDTNNVFKYRALVDGLPWNQWDPFDGQKIEGIQGLELAIAKLREMGLTDLRYVYGGDMGTALPYALNIFAFSPRDPKRGIWHVMFLERTGMHARPIAELHMGAPAAERAFLCHTIEPLGGAMGITGWPDAMVMDTDLATLGELKNTYAVPYKKAEKNPHYKKGAIELTNGDLVDGRIHVIKGSPLEDQVTSLQWRENRFGHVEEDQRQASHSSDTLVYGRKEIAGLFESGAVEQDTPPAGPDAGRPVRTPDVAADPGVGSGLTSPNRYTDPWGNL
jgi:hypothetical protein